MNPKQYIEQFREKFPHKIAEVLDDFGSTIKTDIESHFISTIIGVLKEQEETIDGEKRNYPLVNEFEWRRGYTEALDDYKLSLQKKIQEWEALLVLPRL